MPQALATRARIVLLAADGHSNSQIAEKLGLSKPTVGIWRKRYRTQTPMFFAVSTGRPLTR